MARGKQTDRFVDGTHSNAPRVPDKLWNKLKDDIVRLYKEKDETLGDTMEHMKPLWLENNLTEFPTRRQYVHRLGKIWRITKYRNSRDRAEERTTKKPAYRTKKKTLSSSSPYPIRTVRPEPHSEPPPYQPRLIEPGDKDRERRLAEILLAFGDTHYSFLIDAALHDDGKSSEEDIIACVRIVQTSKQAAIAHKMLDAHTSEPWATDDKSWAQFLFNVMVARCYDWPPYVDSGLYQIEGIVKETVDQDEKGRESLASLKPREPRFDLRLYQFLSFTLERFNEPTEEDDKLLDVRRVLNQFKDQQLAITRVSQNAVDPKLRGEPLDEISCLPEMLEWCYNELLKDPYIPVTAGSGTVGEVNQILCTLWCIWVRQPLERLEETTYKQLGISTTELLSIIVSMVITAGPQTDEASLDPKPRALAGARTLKGWNRQQLFDHFLAKVYSINLELMSPVDDSTPSQEASSAKSINPFRAYVAEQLGIKNLPDLPDGFNVSRLLVVNYDPTTGENDSQNGDNPRRPTSPGLLLLQPRSRNGGGATNYTNGNRKVTNGKEKGNKDKDKDSSESTHSAEDDILMTDAPDIINGIRGTPPYD